MSGVILIPDRTLLDPDVSQFTTMLTKLSGPETRKMIPAGDLRKYDWYNDSNGQWVVTAVVQRAPDDWFSDYMMAVVERPWIKGVERRTWIEDMLFWGQR